MKNFFNNLQKSNMGFLVPGIVFTIVYFVNFQPFWIALGVCFVALAFSNNPKP
jgi:hypothetical protein